MPRRTEKSPKSPDSAIFDTLSSDPAFKDVQAAIARLAEKYGLVVTKQLDIAGTAAIPVSIFSSTLSSLESIVLYLKDERNMRNAEIAQVLGRSSKTIWTTYHHARAKQPGRLNVQPGITIPLSVIANRKLSVLESIVSYLSEMGHSLTVIAQMLHRDQRNIWTVHDRALKKHEK